MSRPPSPSDDDASVIRERMRQVRRNLNLDVATVRRETSQLFDWRSYVEARPLTCVAAAAVVGYLLAPSTTRVVKLSDDQIKQLARAGGINVTAGGVARGSQNGLTGVLLTVGGVAARGLIARYAAKLGEPHMPVPARDPASDAATAAETA